MCDCDHHHETYEDDANSKGSVMTASEEHKWINHDGTGHSKTCDACKLSAVRTENGWLYTKKGEAPYEGPEPACTGYPSWYRPASTTIVNPTRHEGFRTQINANKGRILAHLGELRQARLASAKAAGTKTAEKFERGVAEGLAIAIGRIEAWEIVE